jgi:hypothetical protein
MGWTIMFETAGEIEPVLHAAAEHAIQLVLYPPFRTPSIQSVALICR